MPIFKSPYRFPYNFKNDYLRPKHYWYFLKACWQRITKGVSFEDEFSLDYYIASILLESLPKYKNEGKYGEFVEFTTTPSFEQDEYEAGIDDWDMMIDAVWSAIYDIYKDDSELIYDSAANERLDLALHVLADYFRGLWW